MAKVDLDTLGRNSVVGALAELWRIGSRFVLTPVVVAAIGFEGYGAWTLLFGVAAYVTMVNASFGVAYTKYTAECARTGEWDRLARILGSGVAGIGGLAVVALALVWLLADPVLRGLNVPSELLADARTALFAIMAVVVLRLSIGCTLEVLSGLQRIDIAHRLSILASVIEFCVTLPLLLLGHGLLGMAAGHVAGQLVMFALAWRAVRVHGPLVRISLRHASRAGMREVLAVGGRFQLLALVNTVVLEGIKFLLSALIGVRAVAMYDLCDKLLGLGRQLGYAVIAPLVPAFAHLQSGGERAREQDLFVRAAKAVAIVSAGVFAFLAVLARPVLHAWTGEDVPPAVWALQVLVVGEIVMQQTGVVSANLRARGMVRLELGCALVATGVLVLLLVPLSQLWAFEGVIVARLVAMLVGASWYLRAYLRFADVPVAAFLAGARFVRVALVVGAAAGVVWLGRTLAPAVPVELSARWLAVVDVAVWSTVYALALVPALWRIALDDDERARLREALARRLGRV
jgi:O-antigen/teichoic acid export membrane protein